MKLTKEEESEILEVYKTYFDSYAKGDVNALSSLIDEHYIQIGSAESEVFFNKQDAMQFINETIGQVAGKTEIRNRIIKLELLNDYILVTELFDMYVLDGVNWSFYSKFRASSLMQKKDNQWVLIHQHSSMPDIRAGEGENIAIEKITKENLELRDAVKRRTIELEQKNRELALEAALERVRTEAMGMRKLDELPGICQILYNELQQMGFSELRNAMINIHNDDNKSFVNYDFSDEIGRSINHLNYNIHPVIEKQFREIRSTNDAFSETVFKGKDLEDWKTFRKEVGEKDDPRIDSADALHYYFYSVGTGSIGISTFSAISEEKLQQLKRFRNVFDFAYRRIYGCSSGRSAGKGIANSISS
jgi:ketosteroid isomerase-like protein